VSTPFNAHGDLVIVEAELWGPANRIIVRLALDTGASTTTLGEAFLRFIGHDPSAASQHVQITTGSGALLVPRLLIHQIDALGQTRAHFPVLCHTLPSAAPVHGLLGLDFLRNRCLTFDFRAGQIDLS
jgi:hypothetical protein